MKNCFELGWVDLFFKFKNIYANNFMINTFKYDINTIENFDRHLFLSQIHPEERELESQKCNLLLQNNTENLEMEK